MLCFICNNICEKTIYYNNITYCAGKKLVLCSNECVEIFKKTRQCCVCSDITEYPKIIIDDVVVCDGYYSLTCMQTEPTCSQIYTGIFYCDFCQKEKTGDMYRVHNHTDLYNDAEFHTFYQENIILCNDCFSPYKEYYHGFDNYSRYIHKLRQKIKTGDVYTVDQNLPRYLLIIEEYKRKYNYMNIIKTQINKLSEENKIDELHEIHKFIEQKINKK